MIGPNFSEELDLGIASPLRSGKVTLDCWLFSKVLTSLAPAFETSMVIGFSLAAFLALGFYEMGFEKF